jgi:hypothetical protein
MFVQNCNHLGRCESIILAAKVSTLTVLCGKPVPILFLDNFEKPFMVNSKLKIWQMCKLQMSCGNKGNMGRNSGKLWLLILQGQRWKAVDRAVS